MAAPLVQTLERLNDRKPYAGLFTRPGPLLFVPRLACAALAAAIGFVGDPETALALLGLLGVVWSIGIVNRRGGPYLVPSGVFFLAGGVFVGVAGLYLSNRTDTADPRAVAHAAVVALFTLMLTEMVATAFSVKWRLDWSEAAYAASDGRTEFIPPRQFLLKGCLLVVFARTPLVLGYGSELSASIGLAGVLMISLTAAAFRRRIRWGGDLLLAGFAIAVPIGWAWLVFEGGGRLTLAGLGIAVLMAWNLIRPRPWHKTLVLLGIPLFLILSGLNRQEFLADEFGVENNSSISSVIGDGEGLASVYEPLSLFGTVTATSKHPGGVMEPRYGATFVNTLLMPIPRSSWEGKPKGFGAELTEYLRPHQVSKGQSLAALLHTEFYANFGWPGVAALPLVMGWVLAWLDRVHARVAKARLSTNNDWWKAATLLCVVASLGDLLWVGTFTFFTRGGMAAVVLLLVAALSRGRRREVRERRSADDADIGGEPDGDTDPVRGGPVVPVGLTSRSALRRG